MVKLKTEVTAGLAAGEVMTELMVPVQQGFPRRENEVFGPDAIKMDEV